VLWDLQTVTANTRHGLELLEVLAVDSPRTQVLVVANPDIIEFATDCLKAGAWHYIQAPVNPKELWALIGAAVEKQPTLGENKLLETQQLTHKFDNMVGSCDSMQTVYKRIQEAAAADVTVLITGKTGTGKDLVAAAIHRHSLRQDKTYLAVNTGVMAPELYPWPGNVRELKNAIQRAVLIAHGRVLTADLLPDRIRGIDKLPTTPPPPLPPPGMTLSAVEREHIAKSYQLL
jgi:DNA-binding NtrC family response regulator